MTTETGLTNRLRQHSRRAGLAVGLSMALTTAICIGGFAVIYAQLQPIISDFVSQEPPEDDALAFNVGRDEERDTPTSAAANDQAPTPAGAAEAVNQAPTEVPAAAPAPPAPTEPPAPTPTPGGFAPTHQSTSQYSVNLRSGPGTSYESLTALPPATPLQFLGESAPTQDPEADLLDPGQEWMKFETADGLQGWIRGIDAEPYQENV